MPISITITDPESLTVHEKSLIANFVGLQTIERSSLSEEYEVFVGYPLQQLSKLPAVDKEVVQHPHGVTQTTVVLESPHAAEVDTRQMKIPFESAPTAPTAPTAPGIQVDSAGSPWDGRIHSSSRATVADGTWRQRRNLAPEVLASVQAELKAVMGAPSVPSVPKPPIAPNVAPPAPPVSFIPPPPQDGAAQTASTSDKEIYLKFIKAVTAQVSAVPPTLTPAQVAAACQSVELAGPLALMHRTDLIPAVALELGLAL